MLKLKVNDIDAKRCRDFAEACVDTNIDAYKRRNQGNRDKIIEQIYTGKLGEFAVHTVLGCGEPDLQIYAKKQKSYSADLIHGGYSIHVKSQSKESSDKYGTSWSFQIGDKMIVTPKEDDLVALCVQQGVDVQFYGFFPMTVVVPILAEPVVHQLRHVKRVLYWKDLKFLEITSTIDMKGVCDGATT